jgi:aspartate/methionine/tyrosine aminotransferase
MRGEPDFPTPQHIVESAVAALRAGRTHYADNRGEPALREAVAHKLHRDNGLTYDAGSEILITDGGTLGIYAALMSQAGPGDDVLVPDPVYDAYHSPIRLTGANSVPVRSTRESGRFTISADALEAACTPSTRVLLLNTPWNPVGTVLTTDELAIVSAFVRRHRVTLISDEIYESITYEGHRHVSPAAACPIIHDQCIIVNSLSKTYAMTGWRLGYCAAPREMIQAMALVLQQSSRGPATFVQDAGVTALTGPQECVREMREVYAQRRRVVTEALTGVSCVDVLEPEGGFFTMLDIQRTGRCSDDVRRHLLTEYGVVAIHGRAYGAAGEGTLRVSFATGGENLTSGLQLLREGLAGL